MSTIVVNAKGELFDTNGAQDLDFTQFLDGKKEPRPWGLQPMWKSDVYRATIPAGKIIINDPFPYQLHRRLVQRMKKNYPLFLTEVGFRVRQEHLPGHVGAWGWEVKACEKSLAKKHAREAVDKNIKNDAGNWMPATRMLIPEIGSVLRLEADWTFDLHSEHRNLAFIELIGETFKWSYDWQREGKPEPGPWKVTIRKGALLTVDRIYVRKGADEFSSLTFILRADGEPTVTYNGKNFECKGKQGFKLFGISGVVRFWAKLADVNNMQVAFMKETVKE